MRSGSWTVAHTIGWVRSLDDYVEYAVVKSHWMIELRIPLSIYRYSQNNMKCWLCTSNSASFCIYYICLSRALRLRRCMVISHRSDVTIEKAFLISIQLSKLVKNIYIPYKWTFNLCSLIMIDSDKDNNWHAKSKYERVLYRLTREYMNVDMSILWCIDSLGDLFWYESRVLSFLHMTLHFRICW